MMLRVLLLFLALLIGCVVSGRSVPLASAYAQTIPTEAVPTPDQMGVPPLALSLEASTISVVPGEEFRVDILISVRETTDNVQVRLGLGSALQATFVSAATGTCQLNLTVICTLSATPDAPTLVSLVLTVSPDAAQSQIVLQALAQDPRGNPAASDPLTITIGAPLTPPAPPTALPTVPTAPPATPTAVPATATALPIAPTAQPRQPTATPVPTIPTNQVDSGSVVAPTDIPQLVPAVLPTDVINAVVSPQPTVIPTQAPTELPTSTPAPTDVSPIRSVGGQGGAASGDAPATIAAGTDTLPETHSVGILAALALLIGGVAMGLRTLRTLHRAALLAAPAERFVDLLPLIRAADRRQRRHSEQLRHSYTQSEHTREMLE